MVLNKSLIRLARPTRFELVTSAFEGRRRAGVASQRLLDQAVVGRHWSSVCRSFRIPIPKPRPRPHNLARNGPEVTPRGIRLETSCQPEGPATSFGHSFRRTECEQTAANVTKITDFSMLGACKASFGTKSAQFQSCRSDQLSSTSSLEFPIGCGTDWERQRRAAAQDLAGPIHPARVVFHWKRLPSY
jgi:hypothetical protein